MVSSQTPSGSQTLSVELSRPLPPWQQQEGDVRLRVELGEITVVEAQSRVT